MTPEQTEMRDDALVITTATIVRHEAIKRVQDSLDSGDACNEIICIPTPTRDEVRAEYEQLMDKRFDALDTQEKQQALRDQAICEITKRRAVDAWANRKYGMPWTNELIMALPCPTDAEITSELKRLDKEGKE